MRPTFPATALVAVALSLGPGAAGAATFTSFWALGDSLTDPGNLFDATDGASPPSPPYADGRFSNGPVWAESVAGDFAGRGLAAGNFAFGGARALTDDDGIPDLPAQVGAFDAVPDGLLGDRPVAALWFGANDVLGALASGDPATVAATAAAAAGAVLDGIGALAALGVGDFAVFNLPPLELTPRFAGSPAAPLARLGSDAFNAALADGLDGLVGSGLAVAAVDVDAAVEALIADPGSIGLSDVTVPCYVQGQPPETRCSDADLARKAFFDTIHPTAAVHRAIAELARAEVAPVPLPPALAAMAAAVLALGALRLRRP